MGRNMSIIRGIMYIEVRGDHRLVNWRQGCFHPIPFFVPNYDTPSCGKSDVGLLQLPVVTQVALLGVIQIFATSFQ